MQDYLGVSDTTMTAYIHDRNKRGIPLAVYRSWAAKTGTRVEWLRDGTGPWLRSDPDDGPDGGSDLPVRPSTWKASPSPVRTLRIAA